MWRPMAEVFISYKSERRPAARYLSKILSFNGFDNWFDYGLIPGEDFEERLLSEINSAKVVVVLWCRLSVSSPWVVREAQIARDRASLVPCWIEASSPPAPFDRDDIIDLTAWDGAPRSYSLDRLLTDVGRRLGREPAPIYSALRDLDETWRDFGAPRLTTFLLERAPIEPTRTPNEHPAAAARNLRPRLPRMFRRFGEQHLARAPRSDQSTTSVPPAISPDPSAAAPAPLNGALPPRAFKLLAPEAQQNQRSQFNLLLKSRKKTPDILTRFAEFEAVGCGNIDAAEQLFEHALTVQPDHLATLRGYALFCLEWRHDNSRAEKLLTRALSTDIRNAKTLLHLAHYLLQARGDLEEAENCLRLAIELSPDDLDTFLSHALFLVKRRGKIENIIERVDAIGPADDKFKIVQFFAHANIGDLKTARALRADLPADHQTSFYTNFARARLFERERDFEQGDMAYRSLIKLNPAYWPIYLCHANMLVAAGRTAEAAARYEHAVEIGSYAPEALGARLSFQLKIQNVPEEAAAAVENILKKSAHSPLVLSVCGGFTAQRSIGSVKDMSLLNEARKIAPGSADLSLLYAEAAGPGSLEAENFLLNALRHNDKYDARLPRALSVLKSEADTAEADVASYAYRARAIQQHQAFPPLDILHLPDVLLPRRRSHFCLD